MTQVRALHVEQLRMAVDAVRVLAGLNTGAWDETAVVRGPIRAAHVQELRTRLNEALVELSLPLPAYTDAVLGVGVTSIQRAHIAELRLGATRGSGAGQGGGTEGAVHIQWLVTDHLGTPRIIADLSGSLTGIKRHDYLPFGEELGASIGGRTSGQGYSGTDNVRQKFTSKERDNETGLDYFGARYYSGAQGRFTSPDPVGPDPLNPQTLNRYRYAMNNPLRYIDPTGEYEKDVHYDLTLALAYAAGFTKDQATKIASATQAVDERDFSEPIGTLGTNYTARKLYHFTTEERRQKMWEDVKTHVSYYGYTADNIFHNSGYYFHALQDSYSHAGFGPVLGQATELPNDPTLPDKTDTDPDKADRMAQDTFTRLVAMKNLIGPHSGKMSGLINPISYGAIKGLIHRWNAESDQGKKAGLMRQIMRRIENGRNAQQRNTTPTEPMKMETMNFRDGKSRGLLPSSGWR